MGLSQTEEDKLDDAQKVQARNEQKDELMREFWKKFDDRWPDSIPPGIIFLPGERVQIQGFGWCPRTWLSAHEVDFPDPLSFLDLTAKLDPYQDSLRGLHVRYPGFLLHVEDRSRLFDPNTGWLHKSFHFPIGQGLQEWYKVDRADDSNESQKPALRPRRDGKRQLAIIISRPRPQESPAEIGLLVQIYGQSKEIFETEHSKVVSRKIMPPRPAEKLETFTYHCQIIQRVKISRDTSSSMNPMLSAKSSTRTQRDRTKPSWSTEQRSYAVPGILVSGDQDREICIGEVVEPSQDWFVDGYFADRTTPDSKTGLDSVQNELTVHNRRKVLLTTSFNEGGPVGSRHEDTPMLEYLLSRLRNLYDNFKGQLRPSK